VTGGFRILLLSNLAATLFLTGLAWSLQLVQLPILWREDSPDLLRALAAHRRLNTLLMVLPMSVEAVTAVWLALAVPSRALLSGLVLWCVVAWATACYSRLHLKLRGGYRETSGDQMKFWNAMRALAWSGRSAILLWLVAAGLC
jgi:hypothetical protein